MTIISALTGSSGRVIPDRYVSKKNPNSATATAHFVVVVDSLPCPPQRHEAEDTGELKKGCKPFRVNMLQYGHREILYSE
jgi:hypothetical protein